jgi:uncharacterized protein (TIGR03067 family)
MTPILLVVSLTVGAPLTKDPKPDTVAIVGEWVFESATIGGRPDSPPPGTTWTFTADSKSVLALGKDYPKLESKYTTDPKKTPAWLDVADGPKGTPLIGIYKVDGDTLTLCLGGKVGDRPTTFEAPAGSTTAIMVLKRVKKKE